MLEVVMRQNVKRFKGYEYFFQATVPIRMVRYIDSMNNPIYSKSKCAIIYELLPFRKFNGHTCHMLGTL